MLLLLILIPGISLFIIITTINSIIVEACLTINILQQLLLQRMVSANIPQLFILTTERLQE